MSSMSRRLVAEAFGTFGLVFTGCAAVVVTRFPNGAYGTLGIALASGTAFAVMVTATMNISGGHLNPAVTVGLLVGRRVSVRDALPYIAAQLVGAVLAALAVKYAVPSSVGRILNYGAPAIATAVTLPQAILLEAILTFFLVSAVYGTAVAQASPAVGGFAIGLVVVFGVLIGGPLTGGALNPARAFGPALISGSWVSQGVYWLGPLLGGVAAGVLWSFLIGRGGGE